MEFIERLKASVFKYLAMGEEIGEKMYNDKLKKKEEENKDE